MDRDGPSVRQGVLDTVVQPVLTSSRKLRCRQALDLKARDSSQSSLLMGARPET